MPTNWETLLCLGDSITIGARSYLGYPDHCAAFLSKRTGRSWNVMNHAVNGFRVIDLARELDLRWPAIKACAPSICTIMIGTNDLKGPTSSNDFAIAYTALVLKARLLMGNLHVMLFEIPPLGEDMMLPYRSDMLEPLATFNGIIRRIAEEQNVYLQRMEVEPDHYFDGVHLSMRGAEHWGEQLSEKILSLRRPT